MKLLASYDAARLAVSLYIAQYNPILAGGFFIATGVAGTAAILSQMKE